MVCVGKEGKRPFSEHTTVATPNAACAEIEENQQVMCDTSTGYSRGTLGPACVFKNVS